MGSQAVVPCSDARTTAEARRRIVLDIRALETMLSEGWLESGVERIGAEQELHLVDAQGSPAPLGPTLVRALAGRPFCPELATFNLEANLQPRILGRGAFTALEAELRGLLTEAADAAAVHGVRPLMTGLLPSATRWHLTREHMVPSSRFAVMERETLRTQGGEVHLCLRGIDDLELRVPSIMLEGGATSFQVHLQVAPQKFAATYNAAQLALGPVLALAANSPYYLGRRLWQSTRIPLLEACASFKTATDQRRGQPGRMGFGSGWIRGVTDLFKEDVLMHPPLFAALDEEQPIQTLLQGRTPGLQSLCVHNGTIARWNRPCFGVLEGTPHLRIECRALPAGPTVLDEVANAALWIGLTRALVAELGDVAEHATFRDARSNFYAAAQLGLGAQLTWLDGERGPASELLINKLIAMARRGLVDAGVDHAEADRYLDVLTERAATGRTGAAWMLEAARACEDMAPAIAGQRIADTLAERLLVQNPVHTWPGLPRRRWFSRGPAARVGTLAEPIAVHLQPDDSISFARLALEGTTLPAVAVDDAAGHLLGMVTQDALHAVTDDQMTVRDLMIQDCVTVRGDETVEQAREALRGTSADVIWVVDESGVLVGWVGAARLGLPVSVSPAPRDLPLASHPC